MSWFAEHLQPAYLALPVAEAAAQRNRSGAMTPRVAILGLLLLASSSAAAVSPQEIVRQAEREVFRLETLDDKSEPVLAQSAVSLGADRVVTMCDSLDEGRAIIVIRNEKKIAARIERRDAGRNLCVLSVPGLGAPAVRFMAAGDPAAGSRVYAVSNVLGLGISISDGLVSGIRKFAGETYIQFTAPIAPGSQGGALYHTDGRVIGLIEYRRLDGQNVNFAAPAAWIVEIDRRVQTTAAADVRATKAQALHRESSFDELEKLAREWTAAQPESLDAWLWLGIAVSQRADWQAAELAYRAALKIEPASVSTGLGLVGVLLRREQGEAALEMAGGLLALRREDARVWNAIGWAQLLLGKLDAARQAFQQGASLAPWNADSHIGLVRVARARKDAAGTTVALRALTHIDPKNRSWQLDLAGAYYAEGRFSRTLSTAQRILDSSPDHGDAMLWKGGALYALGRTREAIAALTKGLAGTSERAVLGWTWLGNAYYDLKLYPEAIAAYRSGVALEKPGESFVRARLGIALKDGRHLEEALALFGQLVKEVPDDPLAWRQLGYVQSMTGKPQAAIPALERSLNLDPNQGQVWHALIEAHHLAGRKDDARRAYDRLRAINPARAEEAYKTILVTYEDAR
jgi:tetratricopeptide (TPR) repeat protein